MDFGLLFGIRLILAWAPFMVPNFSENTFGYLFVTVTAIVCYLLLLRIMSLQFLKDIFPI